MKHFLPLFILVCLLAVCSCDHSFKGSLVEEYSQENLHETGIGLGKQQMPKDVFIMFYAKWCGHCQRMMPTWKEFKEKNPTQKIIAVHCPDNNDLCTKFGVNSYPTVLLFSQQEYKYCKFEDSRTVPKLEEFWNQKCNGQTLNEIPYQLDIDNPVEEEDGENQDPENEDPNESHTSLDGSEGTPQKKPIDTDGKPLLTRFRKQSNKIQSAKIIQFKDYLKKLGPLMVIICIAFCIFTTTFICNKCCSEEEEDPFTKKIIRTVQTASHSIKRSKLPTISTPQYDHSNEL